MNIQDGTGMLATKQTRHRPIKNKMEDQHPLQG
jgi:hypothetical protein